MDVLIFTTFFVVLIVFATYAAYIVIQGRLDSEFPNIASGDIHPEGSIRDKLYHFGLKLGDKAVKRQRRNESLTRQRRDRNESITRERRTADRKNQGDRFFR